MSSDATRRPGSSGSPGSDFDIPSDAAGIEGLAGPGPVRAQAPAAAAAAPAARPCFGTASLECVEVGPLTLESGASLPVTVAYRHDGPGPEAPQVLVIHALTGSADAAGDWWEPVIGPGRALDTGRVGVLCANLLGGRYGTTGPTSIDPSTGAPYGRTFPQPTVRDEAAPLWALADALGIEGFALVAGGSLGGMVAEEVALARPSAIGHLTVLGAPAATGAMALGWNHIQLELIEALGDQGLAIARQLAMTTYRSEADFDGRFGRRVEADGRFSVSSYLDYQGEKILGRFDPETYRVLVRVMD
ncbi:MAG TPA: alpha/beta fold hydrolase, partial [Candidatus Limnocylindrales bacterium]